MRLLAPVVAVLSIASICVAAVVHAVDDGNGLARDGSVWLAPFLIAAVAAPAGVGAFVALRRPGNRIAWILLLGGLSVGVVMLADAPKSMLNAPVILEFILRAWRNSTRMRLRNCTAT